MRASVKTIIDGLDKASATLSGQDADDLWAILSALRGPDSGGNDLKWATTAVIRAKTVPHLAHEAGADVNDYEGTFDLAHRYINEHADEAGSHFRIHINAAISAIDRPELAE